MARGLFQRLPRGAVPILHEIARLILRRPLVGVAAVARRRDGALLLVQRGDTGTWGLPGGTLEWGEPARETLRRELLEEAGATVLEAGRLLGVYTAPHRDERVHSTTILVEALVADAITGPQNPIEILAARFFERADVPHPLAFTQSEMLERALDEGPGYWE
jgi:8-oxo-dGTP diphosphatase